MRHRARPAPLAPPMSTPLPAASRPCHARRRPRPRRYRPRVRSADRPGSTVWIRAGRWSVFHSRTAMTGELADDGVASMGDAGGTGRGRVDPEVRRVLLLRLPREDDARGGQGRVGGHQGGGDPRDDRGVVGGKSRPPPQPGVDLVDAAPAHPGERRPRTARRSGRCPPPRLPPAPGRPSSLLQHGPRWRSCPPPPSRRLGPRPRY